ncbi:UMP kinase [Methanobacterium movens]|nr:MAG: uridylate kinase [Methanobacterium sp.]
MRVVITIGGSIIMKDESPEKFQEYARILTSLAKEHEIFVVVGGGKPARNYIKIARGMGASESHCDDIGIEITRLNAKLLITALKGEAYPMVPENFNQAMEYSTSNKIVVMGGTEPAHSTDAVGAILAEFVDAEILINLTSVDGLYDKDPHQHDDARMFEEVTAQQMTEFLREKEVMAGTYEFFDMTAIQMIKRSRIKTIIANGKAPENLIKVLNNEKIGTRII